MMGPSRANPTWVGGWTWGTLVGKWSLLRSKPWKGKAQERWRFGAVPLEHHLGTTQITGFPMCCYK